VAAVSARRNLELKAVDPDPAATRAAALAHGAEEAGVLRQRDTYFHAVQGRLKLREIEGATAELIAYARADRDGPKVSTYRIVPVFDPPALAAALHDVLGTRVVVEKERTLLQWRTVRIHLDRVAHLGSFLELEAVAGPGGITPEVAKVDELRTVLGIADDRLVATGYADLLERVGAGRSARGRR
jgi:adenylate cyclase class IV